MVDVDSDALYRSLVESAADPMFTCDASGRYLYVNPAAAATLGRPQQDVVGRTVDELFPPHVAAAYRAGAKRVIETGATSISEDRSEIGGRTVWFSALLQPFRNHAGEIVAAQAIVRDITRLKEAEQALRASEDRLRQAVRVSNIGIYEHDHVANKIYLSPEQRVIAGLDPDIEMIVGRDVAAGERAVVAMALIHPDDVAAVQAAMARAHDPGGNGFYDIEYRQIRPDGSVRWVTTRAQTFFEGEDAGRHPVRTVGASRDITDDKQAEHQRQMLEAQLSQAQKMESVGRLAGGVAHDFNNMLNVILGWSDLALTDLGPDHALREPLQEIHAAAQRSAGLTRQLLAFARRQTVTPKVVDLNDLVEASLTMLGRMIGEDVQLLWRPGRHLWSVRIDPSQVDQILANLAANARDAIAGVGAVTISTENVEFDAAYCAGRAGYLPGKYVMLQVADEGSGMDDETKSHIFEPFYTTKPAGQGTGLGLATVYGIVRQNEGMIHLQSRVGEGTTVSIYLPRVEAATASGRSDTPEEPATGRETVLLVEDERMMLELSRTMLEKLGYIVLPAATPAAAIELAERHAGKIDLLFTDVVMPSMSGTDLAARLIARYPHLKCLFASGHFTHGLRRTGVIGEGVHFLQKPFSVAELAAKVREALEKQ
jgi:PAS domain S-box-containing protein